MASGRFLALVEDMKRMHVGKSAGYAGRDNPDTWSNFRAAERLGLDPLQGVLLRASDKWSRICALARDPANEKVGESLDDTLMDLASYALIAICLRREAALGREEPVWPTWAGYEADVGAVPPAKPDWTAWCPIEDPNRPGIVGSSCAMPKGHEGDLHMSLDGRSWRG